MKIQKKRCKNRQKITENARKLNDFCAGRGVELSFVTKGFSAMPCRGLSGKRTPRGHCPAAEKREAMPLGRKTTGNRGFSPLTGGKKDGRVVPDSKRQRTGGVAAGRSQERGRVVRVPAYAGGEGAWEPRGGNAPPSALVTGESALPPPGERIQVGPRMDRHSP